MLRSHQRTAAASCPYLTHSANCAGNVLGPAPFRGLPVESQERQGQEEAVQLQQAVPVPRYSVGMSEHIPGKVYHLGPLLVPVRQLFSPVVGPWTSTSGGLPLIRETWRETICSWQLLCAFWDMSKGKTFETLRGVCLDCLVVIHKFFTTLCSSPWKNVKQISMVSRSTITATCIFMLCSLNGRHGYLLLCLEGHNCF